MFSRSLPLKHKVKCGGVGRISSLPKCLIHLISEFKGRNQSDLSIISIPGFADGIA